MAISRIAREVSKVHVLIFNKFQLAWRSSNLNFKGASLNDRLSESQSMALPLSKASMTAASTPAPA